MNGEEKKISLPEAILVVSFSFASDVFDVAADAMGFIPILGVVLLYASRFFTILVWMGTQFWLIMRKVRGAHQLVSGLGSLSDLVLPFAQTATLIAAIALANHPEAMKVAAVATSGAGVISGQAAAGGTPEGKAPEASAASGLPEAAAGKKEAPGGEGLTGAEVGYGREAPGEVAEEAQPAQAETKEQEEEPIEKLYGIEPLGEVAEFEKVKELMRALPEEGGRQSGVELDDSRNEVNLKRAA